MNKRVSSLQGVRNLIAQGVSPGQTTVRDLTSTRNVTWIKSKFKVSNEQTVKGLK